MQPDAIDPVNEGRWFDFLQSAPSVIGAEPQTAADGCSISVCE